MTLSALISLLALVRKVTQSKTEQEQKKTIPQLKMQTRFQESNLSTTSSCFSNENINAEILKDHQYISAVQTLEIIEENSIDFEASDNKRSSKESIAIHDNATITGEILNMTVVEKRESHKTTAWKEAAGLPDTMPMDQEPKTLVIIRDFAYPVTCLLHYGSSLESKEHPILLSSSVSSSSSFSSSSQPSFSSSSASSPPSSPHSSSPVLSQSLLPSLPFINTTPTPTTAGAASSLHRLSDLSLSSPDFTGRQARVLYDFCPETEYEIAIKAGDSIWVQYRQCPGWLIADVEDDTGLIPESYVEFT